jgi:hypothetical protein
MENDYSFAFSEPPATCPNPEPDQSSPRRPILLEDPFQYYNLTKRLGFPSGLFPSDSYDISTNQDL